MSYPNNIGDAGIFAPLSPNFDVQDVSDAQPGSEEWATFLYRLKSTLDLMVNVINSKETGVYIPQEVVNSDQWFGATSPLPQNWRLGTTYAIDIGALGAGTTTVAHNLGAPATGIAGLNYTFYDISCVASNPSTSGAPASCHNLSIPWAGAAGAYISLDIQATNIVINNQSGLTFSKCVLTLKYLKT